MKKLYISCPMRGRTEENIKKTRAKLLQIAKAVFDEPDLEVIDSFVTGNPPATKSIAIWNLGESIKKMASADYYIGIETGMIRNCSLRFPGCFIENSVSLRYGLRDYRVSPEFVAPDVLLTGEEDG